MVLQTTSTEKTETNKEMDKIFYNKSSQDSLGWHPSWFGCDYNDDELIRAVKKWKKVNFLTADGLVGPATYRRVWTQREAEITKHTPHPSPFKRGASSCPDKNYIVHNGKFIKIDWDMVVLWTDPLGFDSEPGSYYDYAGKKDRKPTMFVNHWDVCLSSESCAMVLGQRGISVHFCIDNDGTIYQLLDTQHAAWHAGNSKINHKSIGVEISNAYYLRYQEWYKEHIGEERPVASGVTVHGSTLEDHTDFYPIQLEALAALWRAIHEGVGIPLETAPEGNYHSDSYRGKFKGFVNHYNLSRGKIDCAGLDMQKILEMVKKETN